MLPAEGAVLNYRIVGFVCPVAENSVELRLEIAEGWHINRDSFSRHVISSHPVKDNKVIAEVPSFGREYTWRLSGTGTNTRLGDLHHFKTGTAIFVDTAEMRLRIIKKAVKFEDSYVFSDASHALFDMNGNAVWYLPQFKDNQIIRDLKLSPQGTVTFLLNERAYEVDYSGQVLWEPPANGKVSGDTSEHLHHEFTRLSNGNYMVLGTEYLLWNHRPKLIPDTALSRYPLRKARMDSIFEHTKTQFGTIVEYDTRGNVVWSWKSSAYFLQSDLVNYMPIARKPIIDVHENAFFFDEKGKVVYVSFKNISRLLKVSYPDGKVLNSYGEVYKPGVQEQGNPLFCDQHGVRLSKQGYVYLYNNNSCNEGRELPKIVMMEEPRTKTGLLKKVWEYECTRDGLDTSMEVEIRKRRQQMHARRKQDPAFADNMPVNAAFNMHATSGGNVIELPDQSLFVCMNSQQGKIFIVNKSKEVLWSAVAEKLSVAKERKWQILPQQYRASIISRRQLEQLIWNTAANSK